MLPDREGTEALIAILREIDAYNFRAQYLQRPTQAPGLERVGWFWALRLPGWQPGMFMGACAVRKIREIDTVLHEVFGVGEPLPYVGESPYSDAEWEAGLIIQQRRLLAEAQADRRRQEA